MARPSYPRANEPLPAALPPGERTVGQLVAETIRLYSQNFWRVIPLGLVFVGIDLASLHHSVDFQTLVVWAFAPLFIAAYIRGCVIALDERPSRRAVLTAFAVALIVFAPFPVLVRFYVLPGIALFALVGLAVPAALTEGLGVRAALRRGFVLGRADPVHAVAGLATLSLVFGLSRYALLVLIHTQGNQTQDVAAVLADLVLSPLLYVGSALLYLDQAARVEATA